MNKNKTIVFGAILAVVIAAFGIFGIIVHDSKTAATISFGAVPTLDGVDNPFVKIGGVRTYNYNQPMAATSSVVCSIKNPLNATSTLLRYSAVATASGLSAAQSFDLSTSTTQYASSTVAFVKAYSATTPQFSLLWFPDVAGSASVVGTNTNGSNSVIIAPNEYVNLRIATSTPSAFTTYLTGTCSGIFAQL